MKTKLKSACACIRITIRKCKSAQKSREQTDKIEKKKETKDITSNDNIVGNGRA